MAEIATAYVQLIPSFRGLPSAIQKEFRAANSQIGALGNQAGNQYSNSFSNAFHKITATGGQAFKTVGQIGATAIGAISTAVGAMALKGGFARALSIDNARAKMKGLGWDTQKISQVMNNATAAVKGTAFGLDEAATVASMFGASGIKGGKDMENSLKAVANVAAVSGRSMRDIGTIFSSVKARGKLMGDDLLQLTSSGVPALKLLADKLGVTEAQVSEMVSKGKIDFQTFSDAMREGLGNSAAAMGDTVAGSFANVKAALARLGQQFATPIIDNLTPLFKALQPLIDAVAKKMSGFASNMGTKIGNSLKAATQHVQDFTNTLSSIKLPELPLAQIFAGLSPVIGRVIGSMGGVLQQIPMIGKAFAGITGPVGLFIGGFVSMYTQSESFRKGISDLIKMVVQIAQDALPILSIAAQISGAAFKFLGDMIGPVLSWLSQFSGVIEVLGGALLAYIGTMKVVTFATKAITIVTEAWGAVTKIQTGLQMALNAVMTLNPIGLIIAGIVAVVAAIYLLWNHCKPFRDFVIQVWEGIKASAQAVADWFMNTLVPWIAQVWDAICKSAQAAWDWLKGIWDGLVEWFRPIWEPLVKIVQDAWQAISEAFNAAKDLVVSIFTAIRDTVGPIWQQLCDTFVPILQSAWTFVSGVLSYAWGLISGWFTTASGWISSIWSAIWGPISTVVSAVFGVIVNVIGTQLTVIKNVIGAVLTVIAAVFSVVFGTIKTVVSTVFGVIKTVITTVIGVVRTVIMSGLRVISAIWSGNWSAVGKILSNAWSTIKNLVSNGVTTVANTVKQVPEKIKNVFSNAGSWLLDAGKKIISGLIDGIKNMFSSVKDTLGNLTSKLTSWKGPPQKDAKLLFGAGQLVIQGFKEGLESQYASVEKSLSKFTNRLSTPGIAYDYAPIGTPGYGGVKGTDINGTSQARAEVRQYFPNVHDPQAAALAAAQGIMGVPFEIRREVMA